jgi:hypothetical protein
MYNSSGAITATLPIELLYISAEIQHDNILFSWATASETNNNIFTLEKSKDLTTFETLATIKGAGNSTSLKEYSVTEYFPSTGVEYYRLKQTDFNGTSTYSDVKSINYTSFHPENLIVYPNPGTNTDINYTIDANVGQEILVVVYDVTGREAFSKVVVTKENGTNVFALDPSGSLHAGVYMITATSRDSIISKKLVVE